MTTERNAQGVDVLAQLEELRQVVGEDPEGDRAVRKIIAAVAELVEAASAIAQRDTHRGSMLLDAEEVLALRAALAPFQTGGAE